MGESLASHDLRTQLRRLDTASALAVLSAVRVIVVDVFAILKVECLGALSVHAKFMLVMLLPVVTIGTVQLVRCINDCRARRSTCPRAAGRR